MEEYLKRQNFSKRLMQLSHKLKNKSVIIYGAGKLFQTIIKNYDLSVFNIKGITDKKYLPEDEGKLESGFKIIPYTKFSPLDADYILIAVQEYLPIKNYLKKFKSEQNIIPLVKFNLVQSIAKKILYEFKRICFRKTNTFVLIKTNGQKVYNPKIKNLQIKFLGSNNHIEIHAPYFVTKSVDIVLGSNNKIIIEHSNNHHIVKIKMHNSNYLHIGAKTTISDVLIWEPAANKKIEIGRDCMLSYGIEIKNSDGHTVYDRTTREIHNSAENIKIGSHVWICRNATLMKGSSIPSNCVIGACSLVNKKYTEEYCIIAGNPAKIVKQNINWDRRGPHEF